MKYWAVLALRLAVFLEFLGRAWQHLFLGSSFREFFWNYRFFGPFIENFSSLTWSQYLIDKDWELAISSLEMGVGFLFLAAAVQALTLRGSGLWLVKTASIFLLPIAWMHFLGNPYNTFLLLEFSAQASAPILLILIARQRYNIYLATMVVVSVTFTCHGLYAIGAFPVPQKFISMCQGTLGLDKVASLRFLVAAGLLDFLAVVLIWFKSTRKWGLFYMVFWGFITAFARIWANFYSFDPWNSLWHWTPEFLFRAPHFLLPLSLVFAKVKQKECSAPGFLVSLSQSA